MSQNVYVDRTLQFNKGGGGTAKIVFDTDDSTTILYVLPATDATEYVAFGNATKNLDVQMFGDTSGNYLLWDESLNTLSLVGTGTNLAIAGTTASTTSTTGSLKTAGGLGVAGAAFIGTTLAAGTTVTVGSNLLMPSGGVINFNSSNFTLTHSAGKLTMGASMSLDLDGSGCDVDLPSGCVDKADLATEVYAMEPVCYSSDTAANQTLKIYQCWSACTVVRVTYFTSQALGTSLGIDVVDGGVAGAGTDVIDSCSDDLNGLDTNSLTTPYALSAGDYINLTYDNITASTKTSVVIVLKVPLAAAT